MNKTVGSGTQGMMKGALLIAVACVAALLLASCACAKEEPKPESSTVASSSTVPVASVADKPKVVSSEPASSEPAEPEPFWMLIMGLDTREGTVDAVGGEESVLPYSDTNMLVRIDPLTHRVGILTIPRDTATYFDETYRKVNDGYHYYGPDGAQWVVQDLTGVTPKYYMTCTFVQFVNFVNAIGGVDASLPQDIALKDIVYGDEIQLYAGDQHLDGPQALVAARVRKTYAYAGEASRQEISRQLVRNLITKVAADPAAAAANVNLLFGNASTNMPIEELVKLVEDFSAHADEISFVMGTGPYEGGIDPRNEKWMIPENRELYAEIVKRIEAHEEWQDLVANPF